MELKDIKAQLTINQVLQYYGLQPDKNNRLDGGINYPGYTGGVNWNFDNDPIDNYQKNLSYESPQNEAAIRDNILRRWFW
jgi:hypothetical protein